MVLELDLHATAHLVPCRGECLLAINPDQALTALSRMDPIPHVGRLADQVGRMERMFGIEFRGAIGAVGCLDADELDDDEPGAE